MTIEEIDLAGRTAVITGASRGIGAELARDFAARGMRLGLCARSRPVLADGADVLGRQLDVRDAGAVDGFARAVEDRLGRVDLWINNAGVLAPIAPLRGADPAEWGDHIAINVAGVFHGSRAYVAHLRRLGPAGRGGVLVNISSGAGRRPYAGWSAYCAGKAAVDMLTRCIAIEEADLELRAHAVAPGIVDTAMQEQIRASSPADFPEQPRFLEIARNAAFSTPAWVAARLLELVFDPAHRTDEVLVNLPAENSR
ncbi:MAG TPA: SDR family NAD(P)-dependent oxidoreductase [Kofleriaceae bacterium]|nr:SDR family NAD(P)-dependent oxidoreductase [Kofleriaceae bacterium]